jgi:uncharacterized membrane protein
MVINYNFLIKKIKMIEKTWMKYICIKRFFLKIHIYIKKKKQWTEKKKIRICIGFFSNHIYDDSIPYMMNCDTILYAMIIWLFLLHIYEKEWWTIFRKDSHKKSIQALENHLERFCIYMKRAMNNVSAVLSTKKSLGKSWKDLRVWVRLLDGCFMCIL